MAALRLLQIDAFTDRPFAGNPAAVCLLDAPREDAWMQSVALEMNLSETAFVLPRADGFDLRWFTPAVEVELCGHATLATAHALWEEGRLPRDAQARFHTKSGLLTATPVDGGIELDFPRKDDEPGELPDLGAALRTRVVELHRNRWDFLALLESEAEVRELAPDFAALRGLGVRGVIVTAAAAATGEYDFVSRFFAPGAGIDEDPVTGSAHCFLAPFWSGRLGRAALVGYQASARGGFVHTRVDGDRVKLRGKAVTVLRGELVC
jgi:predicted PhzF superfamily epimerase YddE/YHI9